MGYVYYCNNPRGKCHVGDCVIRAISKATDMSWKEVYEGLVRTGYELGDLPNANTVASAYLHELGFLKYAIQYDDYTIRDFCYDHRRGTFIVCTGTHFVTCIDGDFYDTWDSGDEEPQYYFKKER